MGPFYAPISVPKWVRFARLSPSVHGQITQCHATEYVEAVVEDVLGMLPEYPDRQDTLVAVNPRRIAVAVNRQSRRGAVVPVERIQPALDDQEKILLQE